MSSLAQFVDLHVVPRVADEKSCLRVAQLLRLAGYSKVGLVIPSGLSKEKVTTIRDVFENAGVETASRLNLACTSREELLRQLRRFRSIYDVIGVKCLNKNVSMIGCRDRRVDVVFFEPSLYQIRFNHSLANLLRGALEFNLTSIFSGRSDLLARFAKQARIAREHDLNVVLSSGCIDSSMVRSPHQIAALGQAMGLSQQQARRGISETPLAIVNTNAFRRTPEYVEEGVRILSREAKE